MIIKYKILTIIIWLTTVGQIFAQTFFLTCYVHTVKSQNDEFFLKTIPFDNIEQTSTGKTTVFNSDSSKLYGIEKHFELSKNRKEVFLSNDGKTIAYVIDREFEWDGLQNKSIEIFNNGILVKQFQLADLIDCDSDNEDCYLFYKESIDSVFWENNKRKIKFKENASEFEKQISEKATFLNNDTIYIFTKTAKLVTIDLNTLNLSSISLSEVNTEKFKNIKPFYSQIDEFKPSLYELPNLSNGITLKKGLAEVLDMAIFPEFEKKSNKFKRYSVYIEIIVDKDSNAVLDKIESYKGFPEDKIEKFFSTQKFETNLIPIETEKWRFRGWIALMNKSKKEAKKERKKEIIEKKRSI